MLFLDMKKMLGKFFQAPPSVVTQFKDSVAPSIPMTQSDDKLNPSKMTQSNDKINPFLD